MHGQLQQCQQSTYFTLAAIVASKKELLMIYNQIKNECAENTTSLAPCYAITFLLHELMHIESGDKQIFYKLSVKQHMELECETFFCSNNERIE